MTAPLTLKIDPPIVLENGPHKGMPYDTLELEEPWAGEMRQANGQIRAGANHENTYLRNMHLISIVTKRLGKSWPIAAIERLPDGLFTEASNYLMGPQERAHMRSMQRTAEVVAQDFQASVNSEASAEED